MNDRAESDSVKDGKCALMKEAAPIMWRGNEDPDGNPGIDGMRGRGMSAGARLTQDGSNVLPGDVAFSISPGEGELR
jgi:hypothetical protein